MAETKFKHTEIGRIPEDWDVKMVGSFTDVVTGATPSTSVPEYWGGNIRWMSSGELNNKFISEVKERISELGYANTGTHMLPPRCVLIGLAGQGKTRGTAAFNFIELCTNQSIGAILPNKSYDSLYLYYYIDSIYSYLRLLSSGDGGRGGLNKTMLLQIQVPLPPTKEEQSRIATALYDIDTLIRNLDRTIEKKKNIRQGAMEQLLSGKKRLPGFKGDWQRVEFGEVCRRMKRGEILSTSDMNKGKYAVIAAGIEPAGYCDKYNRNPMTISVSGSGANAGFVAFHKNRIFATDCFTIGASDEYDVEYIYYVLKMRQKEIFKLQTGGAQPHVYPRDLSNLSVYYTDDIQEQRAIAATLTAMDDEIAVLQMERDKYANIRSGMMDDLLTGAKRL